jgi:anti-sigma B factor antagonist
MRADDVRLEHPSPGTAVVVLTGEHDVSTSPRLDSLLASLLAVHDLVVVDLSEVEFLDSSAINALLDAKRAASEQRHPCAFRVQVGTEAIVHRILEITGVLELLDSAPTRELALDGRGDG